LVEEHELQRFGHAFVVEPVDYGAMLVLIGELYLLVEAQ
jgi:hypothetical protein